MIIEGCIFPDDLLYNVENNTWVKEENGLFRIGINSLLAWFSGKFLSIRFHAKEMLEKGSLICSIEAVRRFDVIRSPFKARVKAFNDLLSQNPIILNKDPYNRGWIAILEPSERITNFPYKRIEEIKDRIASQIREFKIKCFSEFPDYEFFEIGVECSTVLAKINELFENSEIGTVVHIVSDDPTAPIEMIRWQEQTGQKFLEYKKEGNLFHLFAKKIK